MILIAALDQLFLHVLLETEAGHREEKERPNQSKPCGAQGPAVQQHRRHGKKTEPGDTSSLYISLF